MGSCGFDPTTPPGAGGSTVKPTSGPSCHAPLASSYVAYATQLPLGSVVVIAREEESASVAPAATVVAPFDGVKSSYGPPAWVPPGGREVTTTSFNAIGVLPQLR